MSRIGSSVASDMRVCTFSCARTLALPALLTRASSRPAPATTAPGRIAAGAHQIGPLAEGAPTWRRGDDLEAFIAGVKRIPFRAGGYKLFSAHQMGTCRMGDDPQTSVAGPWGELHDTKGVWIGDGSAFPTSSGTNPMVSIMALAHRTAEAIAEEAGASTSAAAESAEAQPA